MSFSIHIEKEYQGTLLIITQNPNKSSSLWDTTKRYGTLHLTVLAFFSFIL